MHVLQSLVIAVPGSSLSDLTGSVIGMEFGVAGC